MKENEQVKADEPGFGCIVYILPAGTDGLEYVLHKKQITFGRNTTCEVRIQNTNVSDKHAVLTVDEDGLIWLKNINKSTKTYLNGKEVIEDTLVGHNNVFAIGNNWFRLEYCPKIAAAFSLSMIKQRLSNTTVLMDITPEAQKVLSDKALGLTIKDDTTAKCNDESVISVRPGDENRLADSHGQNECEKAASTDADSVYVSPENQKYRRSDQPLSAKGKRNPRTSVHQSQADPDSACLSPEIQKTRRSDPPLSAKGKKTPRTSVHQSPRTSIRQSRRMSSSSVKKENVINAKAVHEESPQNTPNCLSPPATGGKTRKLFSVRSSARAAMKRVSLVAQASPVICKMEILDEVENEACEENSSRPSSSKPIAIDSEHPRSPISNITNCDPPSVGEQPDSQASNVTPEQPCLQVIRSSSVPSGQPQQQQQQLQPGSYISNAKCGSSGSAESCEQPLVPSTPKHNVRVLLSPSRLPTSVRRSLKRRLQHTPRRQLLSSFIAGASPASSRLTALSDANLNQQLRDPVAPTSNSFVGASVERIVDELICSAPIPPESVTISSSAKIIECEESAFTNPTLSSTSCYNQETATATFSCRDNLKLSASVPANFLGTTAKEQDQNHVDNSADGDEAILPQDQLGIIESDSGPHSSSSDDLPEDSTNTTEVPNDETKVSELINETTSDRSGLSPGNRSTDIAEPHVISVDITREDLGVSCSTTELSQIPASTLAMNCSDEGFTETVTVNQAEASIEEVVNNSSSRFPDSGLLTTHTTNANYPEPSVNSIVTHSDNAAFPETAMSFPKHSVELAQPTVLKAVTDSKVEPSENEILPQDFMSVPEPTIVLTPTTVVPDPVESSAGLDGVSCCGLNTSILDLNPENPENSEPQRSCTESFVSNEQSLYPRLSHTELSSSRFSFVPNSAVTNTTHIENDKELYQQSLIEDQVAFIDSCQNLPQPQDDNTASSAYHIDSKPCVNNIDQAGSESVPDNSCFAVVPKDSEDVSRLQNMLYVPCDELIIPSNEKSVHDALSVEKTPSLVQVDSATETLPSEPNDSSIPSDTDCSKSNEFADQTINNLTSDHDPGHIVADVTVDLVANEEKNEPTVVNETDRDGKNFTDDLQKQTTSETSSHLEMCGLQSSAIEVPRDISSSQEEIIKSPEKSRVNGIESRKSVTRESISVNQVPVNIDPNRCQGFTKQGTRCKKQARGGWCWQHKPSED